VLKKEVSLSKNCT